MKIENIPADIKSKSLKDAREEINAILSKLESNDADLSNFKECFVSEKNLIGGWNVDN